MSNSLGTLTLDLVAQMGGWNSGFTQAERATRAETRKMQKSIREVENSVKSMGNTMRSVAGLIGISLTVSAFDSWIRGSVQAAANAGVFAEKIGLTTEELTTFRYIAVQTGSDIQSLDSSMLRLNSRLGAAVNKKGPAYDTLKNLKLSAEELLKLPLEERILAISKAMEGLSRGEQLRSLQNMAGDSARGLINMFQLSKDEISELTNRAERLGYVYSAEMSRSADAVLGKLNEMKGAFGNLSLQIISEFLPDIEEFLNSISLNDMEKHLETARVVVDNLGLAIEALAVAYSVKLTAGIAISGAALINKGRTLVYTTAKTELLKGATERSALALGRQAAAANIARVSLGALGGPLGMVLMVAGSFMFLKSSQQETKKSTDELLLSVKSLTENYEKLSVAEAKHQKNVLEDEIKELKNQVKENRSASKALQEEKESIQKQLEEGTWKGEFVRKPGFIGWDADINKAKGRLEEIRKKEDELESQQYQLNTAIEEGGKGLAVLNNIANQTALTLNNLGDGMGESQKKIEETINKIKIDTERMGLKTKVEIFNHEWKKTTKWDEVKVGDDDEQEKTRIKLEAAFAEQDAKEKILRVSTKSVDIAAEYRKVMEGTLSDEERRGKELAKNLDILKQYGASEEEMLAVRRSAYESMSVDMPDMGEGGNTLTAQLARIGENMAQLDAWRESEFQKLQMAYGNEENALAESLARKEEIEQQYRERRAQFEGEMNQELLVLGMNLTSDSLAALKEAGVESGAIYKTMFLANKAAAFANAIISSQEAGAKALAIMPGPAGIALSKLITGIGMANAGIIAGTALKGMAHSGIDKVPETGTWLLEKGERVVTANTSAKLDATLDSLRSGLGTNVNTPITVNVHNNAPVSVETQQGYDGNGMPVIDIIVAEVKGELIKDVTGGGSFSKSLGMSFGVRRSIHS